MLQYIKDHKQALTNKAKYIQERDNLVKHMLTRGTPRWGGLKITLVNWCFVLLLISTSCASVKPIYKGGDFEKYQFKVQKYYQNLRD